jgi:hypothetical protein
MRGHTIANVLLALAVAMTYSSMSIADGLRCGNKLVQQGDSRASVRAKCGEPVDITHKTILRRPSYVFRGRLYYGDEVAVEEEGWIYNLGPNKFMRRVRIVDGIVEDVETLDYGYNER